ncbi:MAG: hypothetical protein KGJ23_00300 [Euryarchaeota archaeon]|nr:hypothetical protein [Euryarchaeota archaeon]MDE1835036.1 hypothetical protein [Euryarchaeota archaeon]MDE1882269.1 hypothetical protein [Euryarchaeota archaeon]MDE2044875.1 hypothetical protein [Thermoplasmata archaeon]
MDLISVFLAVLLAGLAGTLALIAVLAAKRYEERRLYFIAGSFTLLAAVGVAALVGEVSPLYGARLQVASLPLMILVAAAGLLYLSVVRRRPTATVPGHG